MPPREMLRIWVPQARDILKQLQSDALTHALSFAGIVLGIVIGMRLAYVMAYGFVLRTFRHFFEPMLHSTVPTAPIGVLVSWCGMRGLVTPATALALPREFPSRDVIVLSAFMVVLGTLILQGFTIRPLIALLRIAPDASLDEDVNRTRHAMEMTGEGAAALRAEFGAVREGNVGRAQPDTEYDSMRRRAIAAERRLLADWRRRGRIQDDAYHLLEDELDRAELHVAGVSSTGLDG
jgi:NhaP-type Na+/H+ or K+/H+ antiporter